MRSTYQTANCGISGWHFEVSFRFNASRLNVCHRNAGSHNTKTYCGSLETTATSIKVFFGTIHHDPSYTKITNQLRVESDSVFAGCSAIRRSTMENFLYLEDSLISWQSRHIKTVVGNTCAAEYIAASITSKEMLCPQELLTAVFVHM